MGFITGEFTLVGITYIDIVLTWGIEFSVKRKNKTNNNVAEYDSYYLGYYIYEFKNVCIMLTVMVNKYNIF